MSPARNGERGKTVIRVLLYGVLEELAGTPEVGISGSRVLDVLVSVSSLYGAAFRDMVLGGAARVAILVNGAPVRYNVFEAPLQDGDVLSLMPFADSDVENL
jgi:molybdopterin converting factor small subunit